MTRWQEGVPRAQLNGVPWRHRHHHQTTLPFTPQLNRKAERLNSRHVVLTLNVIRLALLHDDNALVATCDQIYCCLESRGTPAAVRLEAWITVPAVTYPKSDLSLSKAVRACFIGVDIATGDYMILRDDGAVETRRHVQVKSTNAAQPAAAAPNAARLPLCRSCRTKKARHTNGLALPPVPAAPAAPFDQLGWCRWRPGPTLQHGASELCLKALLRGDHERDPGLYRKAQRSQWLPQWQAAILCKLAASMNARMWVEAHLPPGPHRAAVQIGVQDKAQRQWSSTPRESPPCCAGPAFNLRQALPPVFQSKRPT